MSSGGQDNHDAPPAPADEAGSLNAWELAQTTAWQRYMTDSQRDTLRKAHDRAKTPGMLMDFGCGPGRWTKLLMDRGWQAICMDIDADVLQRCQKSNPTAKCIHSTLETRRLPIGDGEAKLVLCIGVYRVLESDWFLPEVRRVLEPGGLFAGAFFNKLSGRGLYRYWMDRLFGGQKSYQQTYSSWRKRARQTGFEFVVEKGLCWFPLPAFSNSPLVPIFTGLERACGLQRLPSLSPWVEFLAEKKTF